MATTIGRLNVQRPGLTASTLPYGLFTVANGPLDLPDKASLGGLAFQTPYCKTAAGYAVACTPGSKAASLTGGYSTVNADPFIVLAGSECGALSRDESRDYDAYSRDLVLDALHGAEQRLVENIFSGAGAFGQAPTLVSAGTQLAAAANVVLGLQALEAAYAALYGLPAVVHIPIAASGVVQNGHLVDKDASGIWRTASGNAVVFGNYAGLAQNGAAPAAGHTNLYITGQVTVWRGSEFVSPWEFSIDKTTNQVRRFAERTYIVAYECSSIAVDVDFTVCC